MKPGAHRVGQANRAPTLALDPDFFPTPPWAARAGAELIVRLDPTAGSAWEPACGHGSMAHGLYHGFPRIYASDLHDYGYRHCHELRDFLRPSVAPVCDWVVTNPPFHSLAAFIAHSLIYARRGVAMFVPVRTLQDIARYDLLYQQHPYTVFAPFSERINIRKGRLLLRGSSAAFYCWLIWLKPCVPHEPGPRVIAIPPGQRARLFRDSDLPFYEDAAL